MFQNIRKNKIKTAFIVFIFLAMISLILYYICIALDFGPYSIVIALIFSIISTWASYYNCDKIVLKLNRARPATHEEDQQLVNILDSLMVASGLQYRPKLYVVDDMQPNAFATRQKSPEFCNMCNYRFVK